MNKSRFLILFVVLIHHLAVAQKEKVVAPVDGDCTEDKWELKFEDNFDGEQLDLNVWKMRGSEGTLSTEAVEGYYAYENIVLENGICKLVPKKETLVRKAVGWQPDSMKLSDGLTNIRTYNFTSGWMETKNSYKYGKYEVRCKIPKEKGFWPSVWMYGMRGEVNNEIDIFEFWNEENFFGKFSSKKLSMVDHMTAHYNKKMSSKKFEGPDFSQDFHVFTVIWDSTKIEWLVDGVSKRIYTGYVTKRGKSVDCEDVKANSTYYVNPVFPKDSMNIITNLAIQTGKDRPEVNTFSTAFEIDYIRYYQAVK